VRGLVAFLICTAVAVGAAVAVAGDTGVVLALLALGIQLVAWAVASWRRTERFYDLTGSLTYMAVVHVANALHASADTGPRVLLVSLLVLVWCTRLGVFLAWRVHRDGGDARFDTMKHQPGTFLVAWSLQGLWVVLTLLPTLAVLVGRNVPLGLVDVVGVGLWVVGFTLEVVADAQKRRFRADPTHDGRFIDVGLWSRVRHPNYLGEITLWLGVFLLAVPTLHGTAWLAAVSPVFVFVLLRFVSGVPILERRAEAQWGTDPVFRAYMARTGRLLPRLG